MTSGLAVPARCLLLHDTLHAQRQCLQDASHIRRGREALGSPLAVSFRLGVAHRAATRLVTFPCGRNRHKLQQAKRLRHLLAFQNVRRVKLYRVKAEGRCHGVGDVLQEVQFPLAWVRPLVGEIQQEARGLLDQESHVVHKLRRRPREQLLRRPLFVQLVQLDELHEHRFRALDGVVYILRRPVVELPLLPRLRLYLRRLSLPAIEASTRDHLPQELGCGARGLDAINQLRPTEDQLRCGSHIEGRKRPKLPSSRRRLLLDELRDPPDIVEGLHPDRRRASTLLRLRAQRGAVTGARFALAIGLLKLGQQCGPSAT
mmetsp:Transcript_129624/g.289859  ORF Transcript_129624/g.289859 Transcript_129624/m.289859 type:complete len:316 (+) Transcript_129624:652-1599(+)